MRAKLLCLLKQNIFVHLQYAQASKQFEYFRVVIALFALFNFGLFWLDYRVFLLPDGLINWEVTSASSFWFEPHFYKISRFLSLDGRYILALFSLAYSGSLLCLALGVAPRIAALASFGLFLLFSVPLYPFLYGVDLYQSVFMLLLCVFPSGYSVSIQPKKSSPNVAVKQQIGIRGIQLYLLLTYLSAGLGKYEMASWFNGKFFFLSLADPNYQLLNFPLTLPSDLYLICGMIVVFCEVSYGAMILIPYARTVVVAVVVLMHLSIGAFMGLVPFAVLLALINVVAWYPVIWQDIESMLSMRKAKRHELAL